MSNLSLNRSRDPSRTATLRRAACTELDRVFSKYKRQLKDHALKRVPVVNVELPVLELPDVRQLDEESCGAAVAESVARYFGVGSVVLDEWRREVGTTFTGTDPEDIKASLDSLGLEADATNHMTLEDLESAVADGFPVIAALDGHYVAVVGVGMGHVFFQDPLEGRKAIRADDFLSEWKDGKYVRFGITVTANYDPAQPRDALGRFGSGAVSALKKGGALASHLEHSAAEYAKDKCAVAVSKLPLKAQNIVKGVYHGVRAASKVAFANFTAANAMAERVATARGATPEQARRLRGLLATVDMKTFEVCKVAALAGVHAAHLPTLVTGVIPVASCGYLAYSTARDPLATLKAAVGAVKDVAKGVGRAAKAAWDKHGENFIQATVGGGVRNSALDTIAHVDAQLLRHRYDDSYIALVCASLDAGHGLLDAVRVASAVHSLTHNSVESAMAKAVGELLPDLDLSPDYGRLFWNQSTRTAWWEGSDGDSDADTKRIQQVLSTVPGVVDVVSEAETQPRGGGWVEVTVNKWTDAAREAALAARRAKMVSKESEEAHAASKRVQRGTLDAAVHRTAQVAHEAAAEAHAGTELGRLHAVAAEQHGERAEFLEKKYGRGTGSAGAAGGAAETGRRMAGTAEGSSSKGADKGRSSSSEPAPAEAAARVPADLNTINKRLDRYKDFFDRTGQGHVSEWLDMLKEHVNSVGGEAALKSLSQSTAPGTGKGGDVQYWGVGTEEANWKNMGHFMGAYLARNGVIAVTGEHSEKNVPMVSALAKPDKYTAGDFKPTNDAFKDKLDEAKHLPGLERSEDLGKLVGKNVSHLTPDVTDKLDAHYGKGQWIVKCYSDEAAAGYGIFFPQRAASLKQDAQNAIWNAGERVAKYGFTLHRDEKGAVDGIEHSSGSVYKFGTDKYNSTVHGEVRDAADSAHSASGSEKGVELPAGKFMVQPAFKAVGVSDAERAAGKTWHESNEGRVHLAIRDGKAEVIPHATWLKGGNLPVVFGDENTRAMEKAAVEAVNKLPEAARKGQVYAPDVMKTADGYRVVELNAQGDTNGSGYLHDNHFTIDSYVSHLTGREPMHVTFIKQLLTKRPTANEDDTPALTVDLGKHIAAGYKQGLRRADTDTGSEQPGFVEFASEHPVAQDRVQRLKAATSKLFQDLSDDVRQRARETLEDGISRGLSPATVARRLAKVADVSLSRAKTIARTEIVRAHSEGQLDGLERLGVRNVGVAVELLAADGACEKCEGLSGTVRSVVNARGVLPVHPNCRCCWIPTAATENTFCEGSNTDSSCSTKKKFVGAKVGKEEHVAAAEVEHAVAKAVGGKVKSLEDGKYAPRDVDVDDKYHIEVKSLLKGKKNGPTVHDDALLRKVRFMQKRPSTDSYHTVVVDKRGTYQDGKHADKYSGHDMYYKRGSGRYMLSKMHKVSSPEELHALIRMDDKDLPEKARGKLPGKGAIKALKEKAEKAHIARLAKDRDRKKRLREERVTTNLNGIRDATVQEMRELYSAIRRRGVLSGVKKYVPLSDLSMTQKRTLPSIVDKYRTTPSEEPVLTFKYGDVTFLVDGHHRASAEALNGENNVHAVVWEVA